MVRGNTPTIKFKLKHIPVNIITSVFITFVQNGKMVFEKSLTSEGTYIDEENNKVCVDLTSEETLLFKADEELEVKLTFITRDNKIGTTDTYYFDIEYSPHFDYQ